MYAYVYAYIYIYIYPIARWANPATVPGMKAGGSIYEGLKLYINLLKVLESCKVSRGKVCGLSAGEVSHISLIAPPSPPQLSSRTPFEQG